MAFEGILMNIPGIVAGSDLSAKQFHAVKLTGELAIGVAGSGDLALGVLQNDPLQGDASAVAYAGVSKVKTGANVAVGNRLAPDASGALVPAGSGDFPIGVALEAGVSGDVISVLLIPNMVAIA